MGPVWTCNLKPPARPQLEALGFSYMISCKTQQGQSVDLISNHFSPADREKKGRLSLCVIEHCELLRSCILHAMVYMFDTGFTGNNKSVTDIIAI